jgi:uncharacterized protein YjbI with pentapeptide repeats
MANPTDLARIREGVDAWNAWCVEHLDMQPDLSGADLRGMNLDGIFLSSAHLKDVDLREATLRSARMNEAYLRNARLDKADLTECELEGANLNEASLNGACLRNAIVYRAGLNGASLAHADLRETGFSGADLSFADLTGADLRGAALNGAALREADLTNADLTGADLSWAQLVETRLDGARLTGCQIYGISAWNLQLANTVQNDLRISRDDEPAVTVDHVEVAQFVYLMLNNNRIRDVIDTITSKAVLILGRFTPRRKAVLDALRDQLRRRGYVPILFDFDRPADRDITETVTLLARMARFIVADLTDPSSVPKELEAIVPALAVPVQPLIEGAATRPFAMFSDSWKYDWVLPVHRFEDCDSLMRSLDEHVIGPSERKAAELTRRRAAAIP